MSGGKDADAERRRLVLIVGASAFCLCGVEHGHTFVHWGVVDWSSSPVVDRKFVSAGILLF